MTTTRWIDVLAAIRRRIASRAWPRWLAVGVLALGSARVMAGAQRAADRERARWATTVAVVVAGVDIPAGATLTPAVVTVRELPLSVVPPTAMTTLLPGSVALHPLAPGEVLLSGHVSGTSGRAGMLPPGTGGVALPAPVGWSPAIGDAVGVIVVADPLGLGVDPTNGTWEDIDGTVVEITDDGVLVAVDDDHLAAVADAAASGRAVLVLRRLPSPP